MNSSAALPPNSSLRALRGAIGEVVGTGDAVGGWDRLVSLWRIFWALDRLIAVLWSIVHRIAAGDLPFDGVYPAGQVAGTGVAGSDLVQRTSRRRTARRRTARPRCAMAGVRAMAGRGVTMRPVASLGCARGLVEMSAILMVGYRRFSNLRVSTPQNRAIIVLIC